MDVPTQSAPSGGASPDRPRLRGLSVRVKVEILLAAILLACGSTLVVVDRHQQAQIDLLLRERTLESNRVLLRILDLRAAGAAMHADDYTRWDEFVAFTRSPTQRWGEVYLTENIATFKLDAAWVLDDHFRLIFTANPTHVEAFGEPPVPLGELASSLRARPLRHFFAMTRAGLLELWTSSIQPSDDLHRVKPASGYYLCGRLWTEARLAELARVADGTVRLIPAGEARSPLARSPADTDIDVTLPFIGLDGSPVAGLAYETTFPIAASVHDALRLSLILLVATGLVASVLAAALLTRWIARPLALITRSLREENPALLHRTVRRRDELGQLAWLVREFFAQRRSLIEARRVAEEAGEARQRFLTTISHELRTPLQGLLSFARLGKSEATGDGQREILDYFGQIEVGGARLLSLLDELLDLAKFDAGRMTLEFAPAPIGDVAREAAAELSGICLEKGVALEVRIDPHSPEVVLDRDRVRQVIRNLLSNAAKFTPRGGAISLVLTGGAGIVLLAVEDTGAGIPANELELIFGKFSQATTNRRGMGGTGLGLSLCREIVAAHGGRIWAENRLPRGARICFELPVRGPSAGTEPSAEAAA